MADLSHRESEPVDLARLERLANSATPGVWRRVFSDAQKADHIRSRTGEWVAQFAASPADAEFIAAMRNAAPSLLAAARAIERVRALHRPRTGMFETLCAECRKPPPCPTVAALDGAS